MALLAPDGPGVPGTGLGPLVAEAHASFVARVDDEFLTLEPAVMVAFTPLRGEAFAAAREKYRAMRAVYYRDGWRCPAEAIFAHIVPATFFGRPISGGVHRTLLPLLGKVEKHVRATNPEAARQMATETYSLGGFVPRSIAGQDDLSNHAFGLALDIDPTWNPMVKGPRAVAALERATETRFGDWLFAASSVDALAQAYKRVAAASERLKAWLRRMLPLYDAEREMRADLAKAKGAAAPAAPGNGAPIGGPAVSDRAGVVRGPDRPAPGGRLQGPRGRSFRGRRAPGQGPGGATSRRRHRRTGLIGGHVPPRARRGPGPSRLGRRRWAPHCGGASLDLEVGRRPTGAVPGRRPARLRVPPPTG